MKNKKKEKFLVIIIILCLIAAVSIGVDLFFKGMIWTGLGMIFGSSALAGVLASEVGAGK